MIFPSTAFTRQRIKKGNISREEIKHCKIDIVFCYSKAKFINMFLSISPIRCSSPICRFPLAANEAFPSFLDVLRMLQRTRNELNSPSSQVQLDKAPKESKNRV